MDIFQYLVVYYTEFHFVLNWENVNWCGEAVLFCDGRKSVYKSLNPFFFVHDIAILSI